MTPVINHPDYIVWVFIERRQEKDFGLGLVVVGREKCDHLTNKDVYSGNRIPVTKGISRTRER